ncbi:hypothetical protein PHLCEN_2v13311 [Hermanssonia centrifuga]|uniref:Uncharacterized protein n=1 Tax=Hermanssonia centrifuga TaxID=98765 RepID=A0A2R6NEL2_9APHY|nr:hypothetical protein PHLCEN_2v13311 [Hermanssonia centrifuga]
MAEAYEKPSQKKSSSTEKKERKKLALLELRVDLNHIMHHPKQKRYISLFPPEVRFKSRQPRKRTLCGRKSGKLPEAIWRVRN